MFCRNIVPTDQFWIEYLTDAMDILYSTDVNDELLFIWDDKYKAYIRNKIVTFQIDDDIVQLGSKDHVSLLMNLAYKIHAKTHSSSDHLWNYLHKNDDIFPWWFMERASIDLDIVLNILGTVGEISNFDEYRYNNILAKYNGSTIIHKFMRESYIFIETLIINYGLNVPTDVLFTPLILHSVEHHVGLRLKHISYLPIMFRCVMIENKSWLINTSLKDNQCTPFLHDLYQGLVRIDVTLADCIMLIIEI